MATFLVLQQELADRLNLDQTVASNATKLQRWINLIVQDICSRKDWSFLEERETIQTVVQKTAGTVTATQGSATITGVGTSFAAGDVRSYIQIGGIGSDWYEITAQASATSITISPTYGPATVSASAYTLRQVFYSLTNDVSRVLDIRQAASPAKLTNLGFYTLDTYQPDIEVTGPPTAYALYRLDPTVAVSAAKQRQLSFFPVPDITYNMEIRYLKILADMSANTDISQIPVQWHNVILDGAEWMGSKFLNDPEEGQLLQTYEGHLARMMDEESALDDWAPVMQSSDTGSRTRFLPFPTTFQQPE